MNKSVQLLIVAIFSCVIGVGATVWIVGMEKSESPSLDSSSKTSSKLYTKEAEQGSDYSVGEHGGVPSSTKDQPVVPKVEDPQAPIDYFKLSAQLKKFELQTEEEAFKKYESVKYEEKGHEVKEHYLLSKMNTFKSTKTNWFKATVPGIGTNKVIFYVNYYPCGASSKKATLKDSCFMIKYFSFFNEKWSQFSISSTVSYFTWKEDTPYVSLSLDPLGPNVEDSKAIKAFLPIADENGKLTYLKYVDGKFVWEDVGDIQWESTDEKEAAKFDKAVTDYSIMRGDRLGR